MLFLHLKGLAPKLQATRLQLQHYIVTMGSGKPGQIQLTCHYCMEFAGDDVNLIRLFQ